MAIHLAVGRVYRAKKPRGVNAGADTLVNDRQIRWLNAFSVQYDSPSVSNGRTFPTVSREAFLSWAGADVTESMPVNLDWASWPLPKPVKVTKSDLAVLRRVIKEGSGIVMSGDAAWGKCAFRPVPIKQLPKLFELGLVDFSELVTDQRDKTRLYPVRVTAAGQDLLDRAALGV